MTYHRNIKRRYRLLAPLLAVLIALSPLSSANSMAFSVDDAPTKMSMSHAVDMPAMQHAMDMTDCDELVSQADCDNCQGMTPCSNLSHSCGHASASLLQSDLLAYCPHPLASISAYTEYLPTAAPEAAFRPPISL